MMRRTILVQQQSMTRNLLEYWEKKQVEMKFGNCLRVRTLIELEMRMQVQQHLKFNLKEEV